MSNKRMSNKRMFALDWYYYLRFQVPAPDSKMYGLSEMQAARAKQLAVKMLIGSDADIQAVLGRDA